MLVAGFPAGSLRTNCYVVAPAAGGQCVVIDPGEHSVPPLVAVLAQHRLTPVAVLLTHGHADHTAGVAEICAGHGVPAHIHPADPLAAPPAEVRDLVDGAELYLAGLGMRVAHTPGHTAGSVAFSAPTADGVEVVFSGDTLFAGSIGRADDAAELRRSLREVFLPRADATVVLPGHGAATTVGRERAANPYLQDLHERSTS